MTAQRLGMRSSVGMQLPGAPASSDDADSSAAEPSAVHAAGPQESGVRQLPDEPKALPPDLQQAFMLHFNPDRVGARPTASPHRNA